MSIQQNIYTTHNRPQAYRIPAVNLREYQNECIDSIIKESISGCKKQLIQLPTGAGKTIVFSSFAFRYGLNRKILILAHREELIQQAREKYLLVSGGEDELDIGFLTGERKDFTSRIIIASVQTLSRKKTLFSFRRDEFDLIICDEAHHATAASYLKIFKYFGVHINIHTRKTDEQLETSKATNVEYLEQGIARKEPLLLGFTATPTRTDDRELGGLFDKLVYSKDMHWMIEQGYLTPLIGVVVETNVKLDGVKMTAGDYNLGDLSRALDTDHRNEAVVKIYNRFCPNDKTLIFCIDKKHAKTVSDLFNASGIKAAYVDADTPREVRKQILKDFATGDIMVLCNCMVLTEGTDIPEIQAIIMLRPTASVALYTQCVGRGVRLFPTKQYCKLIDIVDDDARRKIVTSTNILQKKIQNFNIDAIKKNQEPKEPADIDKEWEQIEQFENRLKDNFKMEARTKNLLGFQRDFVWSGNNDCRFLEVPTKDGTKVLVEVKKNLDTDDRYNVFVNSEKHLKTDCSFEFAFGVAEDYLHRVLSSSVKKNLKPDASWRKDPISEKQLKFLKYLVSGVKRSCENELRDEGIKLRSAFRENPENDILTKYEYNAKFTREMTKLQDKYLPKGLFPFTEQDFLFLTKGDGGNLIGLFNNPTSTVLQKKELLSEARTVIQQRKG